MLSDAKEHTRSDHAGRLSPQRTPGRFFQSSEPVDPETGASRACARSCGVTLRHAKEHWGGGESVLRGVAGM